MQIPSRTFPAANEAHGEGDFRSRIRWTSEISKNESKCTMIFGWRILTVRDSHDSPFDGRISWGTALFNFSSLLGTNFPFHACAQFKQVASYTRASSHDESGIQYCSRSCLITNFTKIYLSCRGDVRRCSIVK